MSEVKRYSMIDKFGAARACESEHGRWVKHSDYAALEAECERRTNDLAAMEQYRDNAARHMERIRAEATAFEKERDALRAELATLKAPALAQDEREAATDAAYAAVVDGGWSSVKEMGIKMFQAGAEWVRATRPAQTEQQPVAVVKYGNYTSGNELVWVKGAGLQFLPDGTRLYAAASHAPPALAYLDVGVGYLDLGSDIPNEELERLPRGRHMLGIIGTYGAEGYTAAPIPQPADGLVEALEWYAEKVKECRKIGPDGDNARQALDLDGGFRAMDALAAHRAGGAV